jgi:hypothetical protein
MNGDHNMYASGSGDGQRSGWRKRTIMEMARESWLDVYGLGHDRQSFIKALEAFAKLVREEALAQPAPVQEPAEKFCDANCTWSNHHPDCKLAQRTEERNFCPRCGKRTEDLTSIHTCTPPQEKYTYGTPLIDAMKGNT